MKPIFETLSKLFVFEAMRIWSILTGLWEQHDPCLGSKRVLGVQSIGFWPTKCWRFLNADMYLRHQPQVREVHCGKLQMSSRTLVNNTMVCDQIYNYNSIAYIEQTFKSRQHIKSLQAPYTILILVPRELLPECNGNLTPSPLSPLMISLSSFVVQNFDLWEIKQVDLLEHMT